MRTISEIIEPYPQETKGEVCRILVDYALAVRRDMDKIVADIMRQERERQMGCAGHPPFDEGFLVLNAGE